MFLCVLKKIYIDKSVCCVIVHCMTKKRNYTRYTEKYKLSALEYAKEFGVVKASKDYGLPTKTILRWNDIFHVYEKQVMRTFSDETKKEVLEYANKYGLDQCDAGI